MTVSTDPTKADIPATDEATPLLGAPDTAGTQATRYNGEDAARSNNAAVQGAHAEDDDEPMPYLQVILLCFACIVEPLSYFAIFPIIGDMLVKTGGLDRDHIPLWSGIIEATFSVVQMTVMIAYGKLADRIGRKPVLVFSLFGIAGASALFGMAQTLWQLVILRGFTGFFAGSSVTIRAMLSEVTTKKTQARAFSWYMFTRNMGIFLGPLIGGPLADPRRHIPLFEHSSFFKQFPYALSMFVTAAICALAGTLTLVFVKETLKTTPGEKPMTTWSLLKAPGVPIVIWVYGHVGLLALMYTAVMPIFQYFKVDKGGFAFEPAMISVFLAIAGASQAFWMLLPFPPLQRKYGTGALLKICTTVWPFFMASSPLMNELLRLKFYTAFWIMLPIITFLGSGVAMAFACVQLCLNDVAPSANTLGTLNAIALTVNSGIRVIAPVLGTGLHQLGVNLNVIHGHLVWVVLVVVALTLRIAVEYLPAKAIGAPDSKPADCEE